MNEGMKVLLVDDEAVDLEWLRRRVVNNELGLQVVGTANNGFVALSLLEKLEVDIILSDIRMPIMTGLEFARKVRDNYPQIQIVFISGHEDFNYVREALTVNAAGYLLKPVDDQELYEQLETVRNKIMKDREKDRTYSEVLSLVSQELLLRWFNDSNSEHMEAHVDGLLSPMLVRPTTAIIVEMDDLEWRIDEDKRAAMITQVEQLIRSYNKTHQLGMLVTNNSTRIVILSSVAEELLLEQLEHLLSMIRLNTTITITVGIGTYTTEMYELHESYRQAQAALSAKWLLGKNRVIREATSSSPSCADPMMDDATVERMLQAILEYDLVTIDDSLVQLFHVNVNGYRKLDVYDLIIRVTSKLHADLQRQDENLYELLSWETQDTEVLFQFETMVDVMSWLRRRFFELSELLYVKKQRQKRKLIDEIMRYVEEKVDQKITLKEVAAHFYFTPNYLGTLFKDETGTHFSDYLNECKMKRICELLQDPTLKIYEIADRVGYKNIIYFNRQFKQSMGMSPGEYRKLHKI